jgi:hypothetical protein
MWGPARRGKKQSDCRLPYRRGQYHAGCMAAWHRGNVRQIAVSGRNAAWLRLPLSCDVAKLAAKEDLRVRPGNADIRNGQWNRKLAPIAVGPVMMVIAPTVRLSDEISYSSSASC